MLPDLVWGRNSDFWTDDLLIWGTRGCFKELLCYPVLLPRSWTMAVGLNCLLNNGNVSSWWMSCLSSSGYQGVAECLSSHPTCPLVWGKCFSVHVSPSLFEWRYILILLTTLNSRIPPPPPPHPHQFFLSQNIFGCDLLSGFWFLP